MAKKPMIKSQIVSYFAGKFLPGMFDPGSRLLILAALPGFSKHREKILSKAEDIG